MATRHCNRIEGGIRLRLLLVLGAICAGLALAWMVLLPRAVTRYVRSRTGFGIELQSLYVNPFTARVSLRGLVLTNPPAFPRKDFFEVREFRADARLFSLFSSRVVVDDATIDVAAITLVRDERGQLNATLFQQGLTGSRGLAAPAAAPSRTARTARPEPGSGGVAQPARPPREFLIKRLTVTCDRVVVADYTKRRPAVSEVELRFHHVYTNVTSTQQLIAPLAQVLSPIAVALGYMTPETDALLRSASQLLQETGRKTGDTVRGLLEALEKRGNN